jgi:hypothetical protein
MAHGVKWTEYPNGVAWTISASVPWMPSGTTVGHVVYKTKAVGRKYMAQYYYPIKDRKLTQYTEHFHTLEEAQSWLTALVRMA